MSAAPTGPSLLELDRPERDPVLSALVSGLLCAVSSRVCPPSPLSSRNYPIVPLFCPPAVL